MNNNSAKSAASSDLVAWIGLAFAVALSLGLFFATTRHGPGLGNDSWAFTGPALGRLQGFEFHSLHHPPLYGWLVWWGARFGGMDVMDAVRFIQLFALLALLAGTWWLLRRSFPDQGAAPAAAVLLLAVCFPIVEHAGNVGSDLLGAAFAVWALAFLTHYLDAEAGGTWLGPALATGALALLNRFAGFGVALGISTVLWLRRDRPFGRDLLSAPAAGFVMVLPVALVLLRNTVIHGRATTREVVWNGIPWDRVREALTTLSLWYLPSPLARWFIGLALLLGLGAWFVTAHCAAKASDRVRALFATQGGFMAANFIFLIAVIAWVDFDLTLDSRTLLSCISSSVALSVGLASLVPAGRIGRVALLVLFLFVLGNNARRSASLVASYSVLGKGHHALTYRQSGFADFVHAHPGGKFVVNNPPFFFNLTRVLPVEFPLERSILTNRPNLRLAAELDALRSRLRGPEPAYLVVFNFVDQPGRVPAARLVEPDRFTRVFNDHFVAIYRAAHARLP